MPALVTDQFRILNASNFIESIDNSSNSYYVWVGLSNPDINNGIGRDENWDDGNTTGSPIVPNPVDSFDYTNHYKDTLLFGKKITTSNARRVVRRIDWIRGVKYDMYRQDYSIENPSPISRRYRLYDSSYYVLNSEYKLYICIENGSSGISSASLTGNQSQFEPTFTDLEPSIAGTGEDGYVWKYLFTVSPSDIVKFDSIDYITLPNNWETSTDSQIVSVRENGDSRINENQIKTIYIKNPGKNYNSGTVNILGDGTGGQVFVSVNSTGEIIDTTVTSGGKGYTYGIVDLGPLRPAGDPPFPAELIPIIPPSYGHGYDLYRELGADKVLVYTRFDDSSRDFPLNAKFCQVGLLKNPTTFTSSGIYSGSQFSNLYAIKVNPSVENTSPTVGNKISQSVPGIGTAVGYVASYDSDTKVLKYYKDRSLYFNPSTIDQTDYDDVTTKGNANITFSASETLSVVGGFNCTVQNFTGITTTVNNSIINLGVSFTNGFANPEINNKTGDILYVDNRPLITRNIRQKEDIKIILEF